MRTCRSVPALCPVPARADRPGEGHGSPRHFQTASGQARSAMRSAQTVPDPSLADCNTTNAEIDRRQLVSSAPTARSAPALGRGLVCRLTGLAVSQPAEHDAQEPRPISLLLNIYSERRWRGERGVPRDRCIFAGFVVARLTVAVAVLHFVAGFELDPLSR